MQLFAHISVRFINYTFAISEHSILPLLQPQFDFTIVEAEHNTDCFVLRTPAILRKNAHLPVKVHARFSKDSILFS